MVIVRVAKVVPMLSKVRYLVDEVMVIVRVAAMLRKMRVIELIMMSCMRMDMATLTIVDNDDDGDCDAFR
jgi:hypothetical protein